MGNHNNIDFATFAKAQEKMIAKNEASWIGTNSNYYRSTNRLKDYTLEEVDIIINSGSTSEQIKLSRNYFYKDGFYKRIILYYATLLKYLGILIPHTPFNKNLSTSHIQKRYYNAIDFVENQSLQDFFTKCSIKALMDGSYYGVIQSISKKELVILDLPSEYCRTRYTDLSGRDIVEFNVAYFNTFTDESKREEALSVYPKEVARFYKQYTKGKNNGWIRFPGDKSVCFPFFEAKPLFLSVIPATIQYDQAVDTELERDAEEIRKIIVQKIPHLADGTLLFEPDEAVEIHSGTVGMMKGNKNISVLTTYADVDSIVSKTSADTVSNNLEKMKQNIYYQASASSEIFSPTGNLAIETSIKNDISLMMYITYKYSAFISNIVNSLFSNANISFKYMILPITYYNESDYITNTFKLAQSGYSFILPALALGITQRDLSGLKDLENDVLKLNEKLLPLQSAYTQSGTGTGTGEVGAPEKPLEEKSQKTIQNEQSIDKTGGSQ